MARFFHIPMPLLSDEQRQVFDVLERNAPRLLSDAASMFEVGSYGTATSLAILSIEETGKSWMLAFYYNVEDRDIARNIRKQAPARTRSNETAIHRGDSGGLPSTARQRDVVGRELRPVTGPEGGCWSRTLLSGATPERFPESFGKRRKLWNTHLPL